jgi:hypothetical protein
MEWNYIVNRYDYKRNNITLYLLMDIQLNRV